ncbi:TetR family transcriptional regulator C-terminal domain-containing protein [Mesorhizobium sp. M0938]|uniref:TetR family transcriptional regulator C-terminal domain-containing protein n=1 Tax=unclassified Mesorhizobium TaxID=325217 RepID=UPI00333848BF
MNQTAAKAEKRTNTRRTPTREDQVLERRRSLLEAALTVIARKGLAGFTMNDIAREAGCSYGVVSFHFKSKEGITLAALDHVVEEYDRNLNRPEFDSPVARLLGMIALDFDTEMSNPGHIAVFTAFWAESVRNPEYQRRCAELKARYDAVVKADITALAERRGLDLDAAMVARSLNAMIDGLWISGQVFGTSGPAAREMAKKACLFYLKTIFPGDF